MNKNNQLISCFSSEQERYKQRNDMYKRYMERAETDLPQLWAKSDCGVSGSAKKQVVMAREQK